MLQENKNNVPQFSLLAWLTVAMFSASSLAAPNLSEREQALSYFDTPFATPSKPRQNVKNSKAIEEKSSHTSQLNKPIPSKPIPINPPPTTKNRYQPDASDRAMMRLSGMEKIFDNEPPKYDKDEIRALIESLQHTAPRPATANPVLNKPPAFANAPSHNKTSTAPVGRAMQRLGEEVALFALGLLEIGYRFGGKNPEAGLDCSGMVSYVYAEAIKKEMRGSAADIAKRGWAVPTSALRPGDLVFFNTMKRPHSHVGIYIGQSRFIHSPRTGGHIHITSLDNPYFAARFEQGRRYFD